MTEMLTALSSVGEFIGGIAVVVTIVYLAIQQRANLQATRAQALASWTASAQAEKEVLFTSPDFANLYREIVIEGREPTDDEVVSFYAYCIQLMNSWQLLHSQRLLGVVDQEFLDCSSEGYVFFAASRHVREWWATMGSKMYTTAFVEYVAQKLQDEA